MVLKVATMMNQRVLRIIAALQFLWAVNSLAFTAVPLLEPTTLRPSTALSYTTPEQEPSSKELIVSLKKKPLIADITRLDELRLFLEEDDRLTVVKYVGWI